MSDMNEIEKRALNKVLSENYRPSVSSWGGSFEEGWNAMREFALENGYEPPKPPICRAQHEQTIYCCFLPNGHAEEHRARYAGSVGSPPIFVVWSDPDPETEAAT